VPSPDGIGRITEYTAYLVSNAASVFGDARWRGPFGGCESPAWFHDTPVNRRSHWKLVYQGGIAPSAPFWAFCFWTCLSGDGLLDNPMKTWQVASGLYFGHTKRSPTRCSYAIPADSCDGLCAGLSARHQRYRSLCPL